MIFFLTFFFRGQRWGLVAAIKQSIRVQNKYWLLVCIAFWLSKSKYPSRDLTPSSLRSWKHLKNNNNKKGKKGVNVEVVGKKSEMYNYCEWRVCGYFQKLYELCSNTRKGRKYQYMCPQKGILWWAYTYILSFIIWFFYNFLNIIVDYTTDWQYCPAKLEDDAEACSGGPSPAHLKAVVGIPTVLENKVVAEEKATEHGGYFCLLISVRN